LEDEINLLKTPVIGFDECNRDFSTTIALSHRQLHGVH